MEAAQGRRWLLKCLEDLMAGLCIIPGFTQQIALTDSESQKPQNDLFV